VTSKETIRYSEAFKLQVIRELEEGKFTSYVKASEAYGIKGSCTVLEWIRKYGKNDLLNKVIIVKKPNEKNELKKLKDKIRKLESALSDIHLDLIIEKEYLKLSCDIAGIDNVEEFKKKQNIK
jgi:transposase